MTRPGAPALGGAGRLDRSGRLHEVRQFKAELFKALANPLRIGIIDALRAGEATVGDIGAALGAEQAAVSQQLAILRAKNLVRFRKDGAFARYSVADPEVFLLLDATWRIFERWLEGSQQILDAERRATGAAGSTEA